MFQVENLQESERMNDDVEKMLQSANKMSNWKKM
jgi:hypothetical protein